MKLKNKTWVSWVIAAGVCLAVGFCLWMFTICHGAGFFGSPVRF